MKKKWTSKTYNIFISHAWTYNDAYHRLLGMLSNVTYFTWNNHSVPKYDPLETKTNDDLEMALYNQIKSTHIVIILAGMYVNHRKWIDKEIEISVGFKKPIIGIRPWGSLITPVLIQKKAKIIVGWNIESIVSAIRKFSI